MEARDSDDQDHQQPAKRARISFACHGCKIRKLSCRGGRPCIRCTQEGRECTDVDVSERTPLTRKRMTKLEEEIGDYDRIWTALYPDLPFTTVRTMLEETGLDETIEKIRTTRVRSVVLHPDHLSETSPSIAQPLPTPTRSENVAINPNMASSRAQGSTAAYPPTRPGSPRDLSLNIAFDYQSTAQTTSSEWNEKESPAENMHEQSGMVNATSGKDSGTGVGEGVGYFGMSSGATLLHMIQRLAHGNNINIAYRLRSGPDSSTGTPGSILTGERRDTFMLPPARETAPLVDSYFQYFHALTPILHEPTIRAQLTGALPLPTGNGAQVMFNMIFATGANDLATGEAFRDNGVQYYERARAALQHDLLEGGSLLLVQGLAIMAIYLQRNDKPNTSYICLGLAIRIAMALGLHVSTTNGNGKGLTVLESEMRCRIWWGLVTLETGHCMTFGRPHALSFLSLFSARLPVNTEDEYLTVSSTQQPPDVPDLTRYSPLIKQARLAQLALHSLDRISRSLPSPTVEQIKWCGEYFRDQLAALPAYMQPTGSPPDRLAWAVQIWRSRDYMSILYRPVFLSAAWSSGSGAASVEQVREIVDICRNLAIENLRDIAHFVRNNPDPHRGGEWYTLYFAIQASLTMLLSIVWEPHHPSSASWRELIADTMMWFRQLRSMKSLGMAWVHIMESVLSARQGSQPGNPTEEIQPAAQGEESLSSVIDSFDFERYFSEIWDNQTQTGDPATDLGLSVWEDTVMGLPGAFH